MTAFASICATCGLASLRSTQADSWLRGRAPRRQGLGPQPSLGTTFKYFSPWCIQVRLQSSFTALMLSQCQAHVISHRAEPVLSSTHTSTLTFIHFKTLRMLCLKQNTKGGLPLNRNQCSNRHHFDHQPGRLAALDSESAFRHWAVPICLLARR